MVHNANDSLCPRVDADWLAVTKRQRDDHSPLDGTADDVSCRVLKGKKPADLPIMRLTRDE
jgi:hypothetical protein